MSDVQKTILVVDDDSFLSGIYATKLQHEGFVVLTATDGAAAIDVAKEKKPDLIMLDILMPKMDGFEALAALKKDPETQAIPVIMLTNLGQKEDVDRGKELGAVDYLIKAHFVPAETVAHVRKVLGM